MINKEKMRELDIAKEEKTKLADELDIANKEKVDCAAELVIADEEKAKREAELVIANKEKAKRANELVIAKEEKAKREAELVIANAEKAKREAELVIANEEKAKRTAELVIANAEKAKLAVELVIANAEKAKRAFELVIADEEKANREGELVTANKELAYQNEEKAKRAAELVIADINKSKRKAELVIAKIEKAKYIAKSTLADKELVYQNEEKAKRAAELVIADAEIEKRAAELVIASIKKAKRSAELVIANIEKAKRSAELVIAHKELVYQKSEKAKRAAELIIANIEKAKRAAELAVANLEKSKRAAELVVTNKELMLATEKAKLTEDLIILNKELNLQITEHEKTKDVLNFQKIKLELALQSSQMGTLEFNIVKNKFYFDNQACILLGIDSATFGGTAEEFFSVVHPDDHEKVKGALKKTIEQNVYYKPEYRTIWRDESIHYISARGRLIRDDKGNPQMINGIIWDITKRKEDEKVLLKLNMAIHNSGEIIFMTDVEGIITYINNEFTKMYGFTAEEVVGKATPRILNSKLNPKEYSEQFWNELLTKHKLPTTQYINKCKNGKLIDVEGSANSIIDETGEIIGFLGIQRDISERKQAELDLIEAKEKAEESNRLKTAFLQNISHEIRTPMNGILGFSELLKEPNLTHEQQQQFLKLIGESGARMLNTINDIVDISKIEAGLIKVYMSESDINKQIESLHEFFAPMAERKGLQLSFNNGLPSKEAIIRTDSKKINSILTNLVGNAIKFTDEGSIEFGYEKNGECLEFFVKDTGIGIPKDRLDAIFERFIQADIEDKRAFQGSGLGLTISKSYVEILGGKIWVESQEGRGTIFYCTIPYTIESEAKAEIINAVSEKDEDVQIKNLKILIVEDDDISALFTSEALQEISSEVIYAETGVEAIETCRNNPDLDLILMDIRMPKMDGHEATRQIRQFNKDVVIIAQTAFGLKGDREKAIQAGCNDYISKPIIMPLLLDKINKHCKNRK